MSVLKLAALKGLFTNIVSETVSYVNAPLLAEQRGIEVRLIVDDESPGTATSSRCAARSSTARSSSVSGTLTGTKQIEKLVGINDYEIELPIEKHHIVMVYTDRPGIVAVYGQKFGEAGINIAGMQIARRDAGGQALSVLTVDSPVPDDLLDEVREAIERRPVPSDRDHRGLRLRAPAAAGRQRPLRAARRTSAIERDRVAAPVRHRTPSATASAPRRVVEVEAVAHEHHEIEGRGVPRVRTERVLPAVAHRRAAPRWRARAPPWASREVAMIARSSGSLSMTDERRK